MVTVCVHVSVRRVPEITRTRRSRGRIQLRRAPHWHFTTVEANNHQTETQTRTKQQTTKRKFHDLSFCLPPPPRLDIEFETLWAKERPSDREDKTSANSVTLQMGVRFARTKVQAQSVWVLALLYTFR